MEVPYPQSAMTSVEIAPGNAAEGAPTGRWRNGLCDCCETIATGRFWMGWCLNCVLQGQLLERYRLNLFGMPGAGQKYVCMIYSIASLVLYVLLMSVRVPAVVSIGKSLLECFSCLRICIHTLNMPRFVFSYVRSLWQSRFCLSSGA